MDLTEDKHAVGQVAPYPVDLGRSENDKVTDTSFAGNGNLIDDGLQRGLKNRHLQMIALGGVVGASLWYGTGTAIASSDPVGALICFIVVGIDVYFVMQSLGEMSTLFPIPGAFVELSDRFVDPAASFALGWNYWYLWVMNLASEYNTFSIALGFWTDRVPSYGFVLIGWSIFQCTSLLGVVVYGEMEFYLAAWKVLCVVGAFIVAILVNTGAVGGEYIGFRYWTDPGPFANGIEGFGQSFLLAAVYYCGTEMIAITAGESKNPKKDLPIAIKQTFWRILIMFIGLVFFSSIIVSSNNAQLLTASTKSGKSPFAIALVNAGWSGAGNLVNAVILVAILSAVNSGIFICSRNLVSLAKNGQAPKFFAKTTKNGVPVNAIVFSNFWGLIALLNQSAGAGKIFTYLVSIAGSATFIAWAMVGIIHIRMRRAWAIQQMDLDELPFRAWLFPYGAWFVVVINVFLVFISGYGCFIGGFDYASFIVNYIVIVVFVALFVVWKFWKGTKWVELSKMDLRSGRRDNLFESAGEESVTCLIRGKRMFFG